MQAREFAIKKTWSPAHVCESERERETVDNEGEKEERERDGQTLHQTSDTVRQQRQQL